MNGDAQVDYCWCSVWNSCARIYAKMLFPTENKLYSIIKREMKRYINKVSNRKICNSKHSALLQLLSFQYSSYILVCVCVSFSVHNSSISRKVSNTSYRERWNALAVAFYSCHMVTQSFNDTLRFFSLILSISCHLLFCLFFSRLHFCLMVIWNGTTLLCVAFVLVAFVLVS